MMIKETEDISYNDRKAAILLNWKEHYCHSIPTAQTVCKFTKIHLKIPVPTDITKTTQKIHMEPQSTPNKPK